MKHIWTTVAMGLMWVLGFQSAPQAQNPITPTTQAPTSTFTSHTKCCPSHHPKIDETVTHTCTHHPHKTESISMAAPTPTPSPHSHKSIRPKNKDSFSHRSMIVWEVNKEVRELTKTLGLDAEQAAAYTTFLLAQKKIKINSEDPLHIVLHDEAFLDTLQSRVHAGDTDELAELFETQMNAVYSKLKQGVSERKVAAEKRFQNFITDHLTENQRAKLAVKGSKRQKQKMDIHIKLSLIEVQQRVPDMTVDQTSRLRQVYLRETSSFGDFFGKRHMEMLAQVLTAEQQEAYAQSEKNNIADLN